MTSAIGYLLTRSAWNRVRQLASDFRRPGPRIAAAAAIAYFAFLAWFSPNGRPASPDTQVAAVVGALGLMVLAASAWLLGTGGKLVELSGAERALLLPAPISAGRVMDVKLMRLQATTLGNALLWTALTNGGQDLATIARRAIAFWIVLSTLQLHRIAAARVRSSAAVHPAIRRAVGLLGICLVASVPLFLTGALRDSAPGLTSLLTGLSGNPVARVLLSPFMLVLRPLTAPSAAAWLARIGPALAILLVHYLWVRKLGPEMERVARPADVTQRSGALATRSERVPCGGVLLEARHGPGAASHRRHRDGRGCCAASPANGAPIYRALRRQHVPWLDAADVGAAAAPDGPAVRPQRSPARPGNALHAAHAAGARLRHHPGRERRGSGRARCGRGGAAACRGCCDRRQQRVAAARGASRRMATGHVARDRSAVLCGDPAPERRGHPAADMVQDDGAPGNGDVAGNQPGEQCAHDPASCAACRSCPLAWRGCCGVSRAEERGYRSCAP